MREIEEVQKDLAEQAERLARLQELKAGSKQRTDRARENRSSHLVAALTGNKEAQKQLDRASGELDAACAAEQDMADAIKQVEAAIAQLDAEAKASRKEALRQHALELIEARRGEKREQRIRDLAVELEAELEGLRMSNAAIVGAISEFDSDRGTQAASFLLGYNDPVRVDRGLRGRGPLEYFVSSAPQIHGTLLRLLRTESLRAEAAPSENATGAAA